MSCFDAVCRWCLSVYSTLSLMPGRGRRTPGHVIISFLFPGRKPLSFRSPWLLICFFRALGKHSRKVVSRQIPGLKVPLPSPVSNLLGRSNSRYWEKIQDFIGRLMMRRRSDLNVCVQAFTNQYTPSRSLTTWNLVNFEQRAAWKETAEQLVKQGRSRHCSVFPSEKRLLLLWLLPMETEWSCQLWRRRSGWFSSGILACEERELMSWLYLRQVVCSEQAAAPALADGN